jgi:transposase InsO family protein
MRLCLSRRHSANTAHLTSSIRIKAASSQPRTLWVLCRLQAAGCQMSMDGRGAWRDNVMVERLWRSVKYEHVYLTAYDCVAQAKRAISTYLEWYNSEREHSSLNKQTPHEAYSHCILLAKAA